MSILMDALKKQVDPAPTLVVKNNNNGWRNLAMLLGFCLALLLGFTLAMWWLADNAIPAPTNLQIQSAPEIADSASIVAALTRTGITTERLTVPTVLTTPQEIFEPEQKIISVTAGSVTSPLPTKVVTKPVTTTANEPAAQPQVVVSDELRQRFASALAASETGRTSSPPRNKLAPARDISELAPQLQQQIPDLRFEAHVYATQRQQRWVKVNGKSLQEGQWVTADVRLKEITPQFVLLEMGTEIFSMPALTDWLQR